MAWLRAFWKDETASTAIEYAMIGAGISILCLVGATAIGTSLSNKFINPIGDGLQ